jgi:hypothetical protein
VLARRAVAERGVQAIAGEVFELGDLVIVESWERASAPALPAKRTAVVLKLAYLAGTGLNAHLANTPLRCNNEHNSTRGNFHG